MKTPRPHDHHSVLGRVKTSYPRIRHLLVPLDFSGKSRQALRYAVPLAQKFSGKIHLVHVLPAEDQTLPELSLRRYAAVKRLGEMSALLPPRLRAGNAVLTGKAAQAILALAANNTIDLIVLTTMGRTGAKRAPVGRTAEYIVRHATCPVMSIPRR